ncbi:MAG: aminoacyl-tRNA hydrolase [Candidatus Aminicenantes bacterium]|nr:aminoacyl-tRNA hydrolase [Candidatus Aminicenantes bacterium]
MLIAVLGNPGPEYARTRHNIAWQMIEYLTFFPELKWNSKFKGDLAIYKPETIPGKTLYFICPLTFMNLSGESIAAAMRFFKLDIGDLLVIHDDLELDFGVIGYKKGGGLAGHNGLRSVATCLGTRDFNRLRMGISKPSHGDITPYVLGLFSEDEQAVLPTFLEATAKILEDNLIKDIDSLVKKYKKYQIIPGQ